MLSSSSPSLAPPEPVCLRLEALPHCIEPHRTRFLLKRQSPRTVRKAQRTAITTRCRAGRTSYRGRPTGEGLELLGQLVQRIVLGALGLCGLLGGLLLDDAQLHQNLVLQFLGQLGVILEQLTNVLAALAQLLTVVGEPCARLLDDVVLQIGRASCRERV